MTNLTEMAPATEWRSATEPGTATFRAVCNTIEGVGAATMDAAAADKKPNSEAFRVPVGYKKQTN